MFHVELGPIPRGVYYLSGPGGAGLKPSFDGPAFALRARAPNITFIRTIEALCT